MDAKISEQKGKEKQDICMVLQVFPRLPPPHQILVNDKVSPS